MSDTKISRKQLLKIGGAGLGAAALAGVGTSRGQPKPSDGRPNILFITVDQLCSLADVPQILPLPNIRRFLAQGRNFSNYHVHQAPCGPSRSMIYTGQYVQKTGVYTNPPGEYAKVEPGSPAAVELSPNFVTVGKMLRDEGYYTAYKGKWHLSMINQRVSAAVGPRAYPDAANALEPYGFSDYGFDGETSGMTWAGYGHDGVIAADAIQLLKKFSRGTTKGKPWYFAINFINPHDIMFYAPDEDEEKRTSTIGVALPPPLVPPYDRRWNVPLPVSYYKDDLSTKPKSQRRRTGSSSAKDEAAWRTYRNYYFNCIRDVDRHIGQVLDALESFGLASNTIVFLTADHGEQNGAHGLGGKGGTMYKETLRVPLIVRGQGISAGKATRALAGSVDLAPTILSLAGADAATRAKRYPALHGVDLSPALKNPAARTARDERGVLFDFMSAPGGGPGEATGEGARTQLRGVFDGRYKFARYFNIRQHHIPTDWDTLLAHNDLELYDTEADPNEIVNLAAQPAAHRDLILALNAKVNKIIAEEIGADDGSIYPGARAQYQLKS
ncbi:MAG: sulfatase-like hydrolase/transferase [Caulobacteraceae bacterium]